MDMLEELKALGVDTDGGLLRMNGNANLYVRMLGKFVGMMQKMEIPVDFDNNDYSYVAELAHTIKGTAGNLSLTPIFKAYSEIMDLLRANKPEEAKEVLKGIIPVQKEILNCIEKHSA